MFTSRSLLSLLASGVMLLRAAGAEAQDHKALAAEIAQAASAEAQEAVLRRQAIDSATLAALIEDTEPLIRTSRWTEALRLATVTVRLAEEINQRPLLARALLNVAVCHDSQSRTALGREALQKALGIFEDLGDRWGVASALSGLGRNARIQGQLEESLQFLDRAIAPARESGDKTVLGSALRNTGIVYRMQGRYEQALGLFEQSRVLAEETGDTQTLRSLSTSIGNVHQAQGSYELALESYGRALESSRELGDHGGVVVGTYNIGTVYNYQGRYREALAQFQEALRLNEALGADASPNQHAYTLHSLGFLYQRQGLYDQALEYYSRSLALREKIKDRFGATQTLINMGAIYAAEGLHDQALVEFRRSAQVAREMGARDNLASCLSRIGDVLRLQGRYEEAQESIDEALRIYEESGNRFQTAQTLARLARLHEDQGKYAEMLAVSLRAGQLAEEASAPEVLWPVQEQAGRAYAAMNKPAEARCAFLAAIATVESLRRELAGGEQQQQGFLSAENKISPWLGAIGLFLDGGEEAEALAFAERSKARTLLDTLYSGRTSSRSSLSPEERRAEEQKRLQLVSLNSQLVRETRGEKPDAARVAALKSEIRTARLEWESFETAVYSAHPELRVHRGDAPVITPDELAGLIPDTTTALLEFVVGAERSYLFVVTKPADASGIDLRVHRIPLSEPELRAGIESFRNQLASRDARFRASAQALYRQIFAGVEELLRGKTTLIVAPDGVLWDLPFQALVTSANRYLIEDAAIAYAPSLTVLREQTRASREAAVRRPMTLLAVGNPITGSSPMKAALRDGRLAPLPEAEEEVSALRRLYGGTSAVYVGEQAREETVKKEARSATILHFATHAILNDASPMYSYLALARGTSGREDGLLEAWELMELDLDADLAVLSACETARGRVDRGEGMIGLSWALFVSGVPSLVASQWQVDSAHTRDLMVAFHRNLIESRESGSSGPAKARALQAAALRLLKDPATRHPFYWAAFVLVGDPR